MKKAESSEEKSKAAPLKERAISFEEIACKTLIEESWMGYEPGVNQNEPEYFLRVTPKPEEKPVSSPRKKKVHSNSFSSCKSEKIGKFTVPVSFPMKQGFSFDHIIPKDYPGCHSSRIAPKPDPQPLSLLGKEVLCLTEYIVSGPQMTKSGLESFKKPESSKYLRVLKQIKNRNLKTSEKFSSTFSKFTTAFSRFPSKSEKLHFSAEKQLFNEKPFSGERLLSGTSKLKFETEFFSPQKTGPSWHPISTRKRQSLFSDDR